jgi:type II secretory pathway pseudopilin PulG
MDTAAPMPRRHGLAYLPALFIPYAGRLGGAFGFLILVYIVGILAAIAIPAYHDFNVKTKLSTAVAGTQAARAALGDYYLSTQKIPESLETAGISSVLADGSTLSLDPNQMALTVKTPQGELVFTPSADAEGRVIWSCSNGEGIKPNQLPPSCRKLAN